MIERCYTKHGLRAHYAKANGHLDIFTLCEKEAVRLSTRSRIFRRRLAQASVCARCDEAQNALERGTHA